MNPTATKAHFIIYVRDQALSSAFYSQALGRRPTLNVPGMTEFTLTPNSILGLMPEASIKALLGSKLPDPTQDIPTPRCEVYLLVDRPGDYHQRAIAAGAVELSGLEQRAWGHRAAYSLDPDGHVLAFAEQSEDRSFS